jgi:ubiquinol-cytochrome c reductase iron-sulfur subunit
MQDVRERAVVVSFIISVIGSVAFAVAFVYQASTQELGLALALAFVGLMLGFLNWSRWFLKQEQVVDLRDTYPQPEEEREAQAHAWRDGERQITRRTLLSRMLFAALGAFGIAALFPVASLGPLPDGTLLRSKWRRGARLKRPDGTLVKAADLNVGIVETIFPEHAIGDYNSMAVVIRLPDGVGKNVTSGLVAYSKACTHAGCPVALYRSSDYRLICPCHQSVFDAADGARVLDGPADHALPQLPLEIGSDGYVRARGDFPQPPGPGFWQES